MTTANSGGRAQQKRIVGLLITGVLIGAALFGIAWLAPALRVFMRPVYVVVAAIFAFLIWHAWRGRTGGDRRREERRHSGEPE